MELSLTKVHGSENDFFILDERELAAPLTKDQIDTLREKLCNRQDGLLGGADGLLLVEPSEKEFTLAKMRVINSDGSEASMCGNGLRTVARYLAEKHQRQEFMVETMYADLKVRKASELFDGLATYQVEISPVSFSGSTIPMHIKGFDTLIDHKIPGFPSDLTYSAVAVPNPHLITFVDHATMESSEQEQVATLANGENTWFPDGVNVSFVEIYGHNEIFVRTFERGVGFTNACGTAMCASSLMYVLLKGGDFCEEIKVHNPGGMVKTVVHQDPEGSYWMELIGNATFTHVVLAELADLLVGDFSQANIKETGEIKTYQDFLETIGV